MEKNKPSNPRAKPHLKIWGAKSEPKNIHFNYEILNWKFWVIYAYLYFFLSVRITTLLTSVSVLSICVINVKILCKKFKSYFFRHLNRCMFFAINWAINLSFTQSFFPLLTLKILLFKVASISGSSNENENESLRKKQQYFRSI